MKKLLTLFLLCALVLSLSNSLGQPRDHSDAERYINTCVEFWKKEGKEEELASKICTCEFLNVSQKVSAQDRDKILVYGYGGKPINRKEGLDELLSFQGDVAEHCVANQEFKIR
jgi:hypothetical protein